MSWERLDWIGKVRRLAASVCEFYVSQYYSSASLERRDYGWAARFFYATYYVEVIYNSREQTLVIKIWVLPEERIIGYRDCEVKVDSLGLLKL